MGISWSRFRNDCNKCIWDQDESIPWLCVSSSGWSIRVKRQRQRLRGATFFTYPGFYFIKPNDSRKTMLNCWTVFTRNVRNDFTQRIQFSLNTKPQLLELNFVFLVSSKSFLKASLTCLWCRSCTWLTKSKAIGRENDCNRHAIGFPVVFVAFDFLFGFNARRNTCAVFPQFVSWKARYVQRI